MPRSSTLTRAQFLLGVIAPMSLPFMFKCKKRGTVYNSQAVMSQFSYDQGVIILFGDHSSSNVAMVEARFMGYCISQILEVRRNFIGLD